MLASITNGSRSLLMHSPQAIPLLSCDHDAAQAAADKGRLVWSPVNHIPQRDLAPRTGFVALSTANDTELTLTGRHIVYVSDASSGLRVPVPARDVKVR